jgi:hypothetical protein
MKKSEDTPVEECSKARRVPTETGFKLRVALPSSQQLKGYPSVTLAITSGASAGERQSAPRCNGLSAN